MKATTVAFLTETTCGESCWHAKEEICRCSCGGKNHGILKTENGEQPIRQSKIDGKRYQLLAVGPRENISAQMGELLATVNIKYSWHKSLWPDTWVEKYATPQQAAHWKELSAFKDMENSDRYRVSPSLLWQKASP